MKKIIRKIIGNSIIRALLKQIPVIGAPVAEILTNISAEKGVTLKHSWVSIIIQLATAGTLITLVLTKTISIDEFLKKILFIL